MEGLPQSIIPLDYALNHVASIEKYQALPVALFGHSWGGHAIGNVLNMHPDIKSAVIVAGFYPKNLSQRGEKPPFHADNY